MEEMKELHDAQSSDLAKSCGETNSQAVSEVPRWRAWCERFSLWIAFTLFVLLRAIDRVIMKQVNDLMIHYNSAIINVFWPISIQVLTIITVVGYVMMQRRKFGGEKWNWRFFLPGSKMASADGPVSQWKLAQFSLWDQVNASISAPPSGYLPLPIQSLLSNCNLLWTVLISYFWLKTRFTMNHYCGCILVVLSILIAIAPQIDNKDCSLTGKEHGMCLSAYKSASGDWVDLLPLDAALWYTIFIISTVPMGISNCYKQWLLKKCDLDIFYAVWWSGNWQIVWGFLMLPLTWIHLPNMPVVYPQDTFKNVADGWTCLMGGNPTPEITGDMGNSVCVPAAGQMNAFGWFLIYLLFNLSFNILYFYLVKRMSALWTVIATTVCLDLVNILSQFSFLMGKGAKAMSFSMWVATFVASMALFIYNTDKEVDSHGNSVYVTHMKDYSSEPEKEQVEEGPVV